MPYTKEELEAMFTPDELEGLTEESIAQLEKEDAAYDAQDKWIRENCGEPAAKSANYGWFVDDVEGCICTKVYGHGVLITDIETLQHTWEPYD